MKTDLYTKIVLTVIAIFLGVLVFQNITIVTTAQATPAPIPQHTQASNNGIVDVNIVQYNGEMVDKRDGIPIHIKEISSYCNNLKVQIEKNNDK